MNQQSAHRYEDRLLEFAYGELPAAEARSIEAHVKGCARCTGALREIDGVRRQMSQLAPEPAPEEGLESLLAYAQQAARRAQAGPAPARGVRRWLFGLAGTASLAAVLLVVGVVANRVRPQLPSFAPEALKTAAAREELHAQEAAAPAPPAAEPRSGQGLAPEQERQDKAPAADLPVAGALASEAAGNEDAPQENWRRVEDYKLSTRDAPQYKQAGPDMLDRGQNFVPGRGTRPVLPTAGAQEAARLKSAPLPADGEMTFPPKRSKAPSRAPVAGSGGGFESGSGLGSSSLRKSVPAQYDEDSRVSAQVDDQLAEARQPPPQAEAKSAPLEVARSVGRESSWMAKDKGGASEVAAKEEVAKKVVSATAPSSPTGWAGSKADLSSAPGKAAPAPAPVAAPAAEPPPPPKMRAPAAQELYAAANRARAGSPEEIEALIGALDAGLSGQYRLSALQRLCIRLENQDDARAYDYCSAWANADPGSAVANKRAREAEVRWSARKAKAKPAQAADSFESSPAATTPKPAEPAVKY